jgi:hypothetical protein
MAKYELNGHVWNYMGREVKKGDVVDVDPEDAFIKQLVAASSLVPVGTNAKIEEEREALATAQAARDAEAVKASDEEAAVRVAHDQRRPYNAAESQPRHRQSNRRR